MHRFKIKQIKPRNIYCKRQADPAELYVIKHPG